MLAVLLLVLVSPPVRAQAPPVCEGGVTALVLSGGGAKGLAHISVIRVLDSLGARPDLVVGTSMGALVGALYASGHTGASIDSIARATPPSALFAAGDPRVPRPWRPLVPLLIWEEGDQGFSLQSPAVREAGANATLAALHLKGNLLARGWFDSLPIPFRAVATDLATREAVVLSQGDLAQAIRASTAIPLVFPPERLDGRVLTDGGLSANIPVAVARAAGATRVIVSDVSGRRLDVDDLRGPIAMAEQLAAFLFAQPPDTIGPGDVYLKIGVEDYGALEFGPRALDSIRIHGRRAADSILPRASCLPRAGLAPRTAPTRVAGFTVRDASLADEQVLSRLLGLVVGEPVNESLLREQLERFGGLDAYRAIWLHPTGSGDSVTFSAEVRPGPERFAGGGFAYDNDLGGRLGAAYLDRRLFRLPLEASALGGFSRRKTDLTLGLRRYFGFGRSRVAAALEGWAVEEIVPLYTASGAEFGRPLAQEAGLFAGFERDFASDWVVRLGVEGLVWRDVDTTLEHRRGDNGRSGGLVFGAARYGSGTVLALEASWTGTYRRLLGEVSIELRSGKLTLTPRARAGWGEGLPTLSRFRLGGSEGFPGLAVEELRGDREVYGALQATWPIRGPVTARLLVAAGRTALGGTLFDDGNWLGGARAGIGADTPLGPVRFEYGIASSGRDNLFVRIGRWF